MTTMHVKAAFREKLPLPKKILFLKICDMANQENICWPGNWLLEKDCELSKVEVEEGLDYLIKAGLIERKYKIYVMGKIRDFVYIVFPEPKNNNIKNNEKEIKEKEKTSFSDASNLEKNKLEKSERSSASSAVPVNACEVGMNCLQALKKSMGVKDN